MALPDTSNFLVSEAHLLSDEARKKKSERIKDLGEPIRLQGKAIDIVIQGKIAWIAESTATVKKIDLETGKSLQVYRGHTAPVTTLTFCDTVPGSGDRKILATGSWDKTIKLWDTEVNDPFTLSVSSIDTQFQSRSLMSSTDAHQDFVKVLYVFPTVGLLISGSSDKTVRFWDVSQPSERRLLPSLGSISSHTRPVECLQGNVAANGTIILYTGDTMGVIKVWELLRESGSNPRWKASLKRHLDYHRTRINDIYYGNGQLWTASADETVQVSLDPDLTTESKIKLPRPIIHPKQVRCVLPVSLTDVNEPYLITGSDDTIRVYDLSTFDQPEMIREVEAHWHDILKLRFWIRKSNSSDGLTRMEPWVVSTSLDGTIRKWRLNELVLPTSEIKAAPIVEKSPTPAQSQNFELTEDEERELAELLDD